MRIAVVSDTHGDPWAIRECIEAAGKVDAWIHLGDNTRDTEELQQTGVPVYAVRGNTDFGAIEPLEQVITLEGKRIFLCHGHLYAVGADPYRLNLKARELECDAALFGHTHVPFLDESGHVTLMNPGSPSRPRQGSRRCMGFIRINGDDLDASLRPLEP